MYSMVWCLATALAWLTLRLANRGSTLPGAAAWIGVAAAGLLQPLLLRLRRAGLRPVAAPLARPPLTTRGDRSRSDHGDRRGALVRASARLARPLADHRRMAQRASPLARARHPALRAGVEPARGRQLLGRLARRWTRHSPRSMSCWPSGCSAGAKLTSLFCDRPPADLAVGGARGARALRGSTSSATPALPAFRATPSPRCPPRCCSSPSRFGRCPIGLVPCSSP